MNLGEIYSVVNTLVLGSGNMGHDVIAIRCYDSWRIDKERVLESINEESDVKTLFYNYKSENMSDAYEPFLDWIKEIYINSGEKTPESFMEKCNVYPIHRKMFCSYIRTGICIRAEEVILPEIDYDRAKVMESIVNILSYGTEQKRILIVLENIHFAGSSTIALINRIMKDRENDKISILCTYDDTYGIPTYMNEQWDEFIQSLEKKNLVIAMSSAKKETPDNDIKKDEKNFFVINFKDINVYTKKIYTMLKTLAVKQALFYLNDICQKLKIDKYDKNIEETIKFYEMYALAYLYDGKYESALMICDNIKNLCKGSKQIEFNTDYIIGMSQLYMGQNVSARSVAKRCSELARTMNDEDMIFASKVLEGMVILRGFTTVVFVDKGEKKGINDDFLADLEKNGWMNHLAYFQIYAYEQEKEIYVGDDSKRNFEHFNKGIEIIRQNKNDKFLIDAYKKCAMFYSVVGNIEEVDRNYKKCIGILRGMDEKAEEADIYNGLGYNRMVREEFERANVYYNQALEIYCKLNRPDMISETFYNMCINAIMADDYKSGCMYIAAAIKLLDNADIFKPRICNRAKLYGMAALCNYKIGNGYKTQIYIEQMERILRHILKPDGEPDFAMWDDEMFYYYFVKGLMFFDEKKDEESADAFEHAEFHMRRSEGNMYVSYARLICEEADVLERLGKMDLRKKKLEECLKFCEDKEYAYSISKISAKLSGKQFERQEFILDLSTNINQVLLAAKRIGTEKELVTNNKNMDFLSNWQEQLATDDMSEKDMIQRSMATLRNNFGLDRVMLFTMEKGHPAMKYCDKEIKISEDVLEKIVLFFNERKSSFIVSRMDSMFEEYKDIIKYFGMNTVVSMIGIPVFHNDELQTVLITYQIMYENFTATKVVLKEADLKVFRFSLRQLMNEVYRAYARERIHEMNRELKEKNQLLENLAHTDSLTGLLNRQGFNRIVDERLDVSNASSNLETYFTVMYIDLDNFKYCNDTFGHDIGDLVLKMFSDLFKSIIGKSGYVVRYGGDEFVIVVENVNIYYGEEVAEAIFEELRDNNAFLDIIQQHLGREVTIDEKNKLSCSIGIAVDESVNVKTISELLKCADEALYDVKKASKHDYKVWGREGTI